MAKSSAAFNIIFGAKTGQLTKALNTTQRKLLKASAQMSATGKSLTRNLTLPLLAVGAGSLKLAVSFESSMLKVKAVSGATGKEFESLKNKALELGKSTTFTASEVAGLQLEYAKLGFTTEDINKVTESTLFLAQATGSDLAQAAAVAGATLGGFQLDATETARVTDVMAASFSSTPLDINTFQESMKAVAPVALSAGVSIEQTTAMLGVLSKAGISGSQAGTSLRRILSEL
jgi:TP901 family phage tail tape measure protein